MMSEWVKVHHPLHLSDTLPPERKVVLVWIEGQYLPFCGYIRYAAGDKECPYFVVYHGNDNIGAAVIAWNDCIPDGPLGETNDGRGFSTRPGREHASKQRKCPTCGAITHPPHPMQEIVLTKKGKAVFRENKIVLRLWRANTSLHMSEVLNAHSPDDREQFLQLIGYSVQLYESSNYIRNESIIESQRIAKQLLERKTNEAS